jgi:hypothetical protein
MSNNSAGENVSEIQSLTERVQALQRAFESWSVGYVLLVGFAVIIAAFLFFTQFMSIRIGKQLTQAQSALDAAKGRQLASELKEKDEQIESVKAGAAIETKRVETEAKERIARVEAGASIKIAETQRETEQLRDKNLSLERAISPRILEQNLAGRLLKPFSNTEVTVISLQDFEPRRTAGQIRFMLRSVAGWKKFPGPLPRMAFFDGVVVHTSLGTQPTRAAAEAFVSVLKNNGIEARTGYPVQELGTNGVLVVVGPKPLPSGLQLKPENVPADKHGNRVWGNTLEE